MQIVAVVANTRMRTLRTEVGKVPCECALVDRKNRGTPF